MEWNAFVLELWMTNSTVHNSPDMLPLTVVRFGETAVVTGR